MSSSDRTRIFNAPFEAYKGNDPYIFVSYAHKDRSVIYPEINRLNDLGYRLWYDEGIAPGTEWTEELATALDNCLVFLVFISPRAVKSHNVKNEIAYVLAGDKVFIAIHIEETSLTKGLKFQVGRFQAIMKYALTDQQYQRKLERALPTVVKNEPHALIPDILLAEEIYAGEAWAANRKGASWECEDMVIAPASEIFPTFLLADGVSPASGALAIRITQDVFSEWQKSVHVPSLSHAKEALCDLFIKINKKLLEVRRQRSCGVETAAVAVAIYKGGNKPVVLTISYGNIEHLITYEKATEGPRLIHSTLPQGPLPLLGSHLHSDLTPQKALVEVPLEREGNYYVRAFSDGVNGVPSVLSLLRSRKGIRQIVSEASRWAERYPALIGYDDWSIAGFDVVVRRTIKKTSSSGYTV